MSGVQVLVLVLGLVNVAIALGPADAMTWRTHRWGPQLLVMACGVVAAGCAWLGWAGIDLEFAVCGQFGVLAVLLHMRERPRPVLLVVPAETKLREIRAREEHAQ